MPRVSAVYHTVKPYIIDFSILFGIIRSVKFSEVSNMSDNKLLDLSFEFAVAVVNLSDSIKMPKVHI